jgi:hypothetical protein
MRSPAEMKIIQIEITNACPKRCSNCTRFCGHHTKPYFMDFDTFKQAVDSMKGFKGIVGIMGGEPTIHPEFDRFVRYYREHIGYDDFSTASYEPTSDFIRHILANAYHTDYSNQRGLWTSVGPKYYKHFELIQDTFGYQLVNDHSNPSMHETLMVTRKEVGIPDEQWVRLRDKCWIQNLWSASITPKGAFFCEVAAAMDSTLGGPGGWKIEPGWWKRKPADFADQLHWCEMCSAALPMPKRNANEETDDVSPVWREKLIQIKSPKLDKGLVNEFDPKAYRPDEHQVIAERTPYMDDQEQRFGGARKTILPQQIVSIAWLTGALSGDAAGKLLERLRAAGRLDAVVSASSADRERAQAAGVAFFDAAECGGTGVLEAIRQNGIAKDWVLLMRDGAPADAMLQLLSECVFNPGCVYLRDAEACGGAFQFFNMRAAALEKAGDLFGIGAAYPKRKRVRLSGNRASDYYLSAAGMFYRRLIKRFYWAQKRLGLKLDRTGGGAGPSGVRPPCPT